MASVVLLSVLAPSKHGFKDILPEKDVLEQFVAGHLS